MGKISKRYAESAKLVDKTKEYGAGSAARVPTFKVNQGNLVEKERRFNIHEEETV